MVRRALRSGTRGAGLLLNGLGLPTRRTDTPAISDARILMIAANGFEEAELLDTRQRLLDRGAKVTLASLDTNEIQGETGDEPGRSIKPDLAIEDVDSKDYDALVLPGGTRNPDKLRTNELVVYTVKKFVDA